MFLISTLEADILRLAVIAVVKLIVGRSVPVPSPIILTPAIDTTIPAAAVIVSVYQGATYITSPLLATHCANAAVIVENNLGTQSESGTNICPKTSAFG